MAFAASLNHRRSVPLLITAGVHAVLLYWLLQYRPPMPKQPEAERWSVLLLLPSAIVPPKAEQEKTTPPVSSRSIRAAAASSSSRPSGSETLEPSTNNAITIAPEETGEQPSKPTIDWSAAAASAAKDAAARFDAKPQQRALDGSDKREIAKPKKNHEFEWRPKAKRFGFTPQGLPYIQLNRRCVWSILVACAIGKLPPPNRDLFEGMNDPDEVKDSIPDLKQQP